jgi:hypothetical protein
MEFEEFLLPLLSTMSEKEKKNQILFKSEIDHFQLVSKIFAQRFIQQLPIEDLETAVDEENNHPSKLIKHKRNKQHSKQPIKSNSISSKYIKDIVSKKNPNLDQSPQNNNNLKNNTNLNNNVKKNVNNDKNHKKKYKISQKNNKLISQQETNLKDFTILIDKSILNHQIPDIQPDDSLLQTLIKKLENNDYFQHNDKYCQVFLGRKYKPNNLFEEENISLQILRNWRRKLIFLN